jgi:hypothetical protein
VGGPDRENRAAPASGERGGFQHVFTRPVLIDLPMPRLFLSRD